MANQKKGAIGYRPECWNVPRRVAALSALWCIVLEVSAALPPRVEPKVKELRSRFEESCAEIPRCRTECQHSKDRSQDLDHCLMEGQMAPVGEPKRCSMEHTLEMRAFYTVVGCVIYFYPGLEIPVSEGQ